MSPMQHLVPNLWHCFEGYRDVKRLGLDGGSRSVRTGLWRLYLLLPARSLLPGHSLQWKWPFMLLWMGIYWVQPAALPSTRDRLKSGAKRNPYLFYCSKYFVTVTKYIQTYIFTYQMSLYRQQLGTMSLKGSILSYYSVFSRKSGSLLFLYPLNILQKDYFSNLQVLGCSMVCSKYVIVTELATAISFSCPHPGIMVPCVLRFMSSY